MSTAGLRDHDKVDFWQDIVRRSLLDLSCTPVRHQAFTASLQSAWLNDLSIATISTSAHRVSRLPTGISRTGEESVIVNFVASGSICIEQDGRSATLAPGDGAVCDAQRPYHLRFDDANQLITVKLPRRLLAHRAASLHRVTARSLSQSSQMCPILFSYLNGFSQNASRLNGAAVDKVFNNFTELLSAALDELIVATPLPLSEYRATALIRVKDFLERHLDDCDLDAATVSATLSLSPRYINKLFEAESTSLARYLWRRRLERAAVDLRDPARRFSGISDIAMSHGFNDLSHFSRSFRQRFGMSPRAYRCEPAS